jgi:hypothetical protein
MFSITFSAIFVMKIQEDIDLREYEKKDIGKFNVEIFTSVFSDFLIM